jgi:hypothetical protein
MLKSMDTNCSSDCSGTAPGEATNSKASDPARGSTRRDVLRTIAIHVWLVLFALSVWQFGGRNFVLGGSGMLLCITTVPVIGLDSWQERLTWGITLACGCLGFVAGIVLCLYVLLRFDSFMYVFGGKAGLLTAALPMTVGQPTA